MEIPAKDVMKALQLVQEISAVAHRAWMGDRRLELAEIAAVDINHRAVNRLLAGQEFAPNGSEPRWARILAEEEAGK